ncbi:MAG: ATP-binding protein [Actinomycetota bacterium]|nr:ATP-binding protein [Actinomycetota bacterium]
MIPAPDTSPAERVIELPATAAAAGLARRQLTAVPGIAGEVGYKVLLMTSELIGVCVQDVEPGPQTTICLTVSVTPDRVRVEVTCRAEGVSLDAALRSSESPSLGGYGLRIVDRMAEAWGVQPGGTAIWFELARG